MYVFGEGEGGITLNFLVSAWLTSGTSPWLVTLQEEDYPGAPCSHQAFVLLRVITGMRTVWLGGQMIVFFGNVRNTGYWFHFTATLGFPLHQTNSAF